MSTKPETIFRLRSRTAGMDMFQVFLVIPNSSLRLKQEATLALWIMFLLGRQAMLGQEPPIYFRSITAAFIPFLASVQARNLPASPLPRTRRSYPSGFDFCVFMGSIHLADTLGSFLVLRLSLAFVRHPFAVSIFELRLDGRPHKFLGNCLH